MAVFAHKHNCLAKYPFVVADIEDGFPKSYILRAEAMRKRAFTLVEVILVVTILGILAALVMPTFQDHIAKARESAAKDSLSTMRSQIELYKLHHKGALPGYVNGAGATEGILQLQFTRTTTETGSASPFAVPSGDFKYGPYVMKLPKNPFNKLSNIAYVAEATAFSDATDGTSSGWLYKKETGEFGLNWTGTDSQGVSFLDY